MSIFESILSIWYKPRIRRLHRYLQEHSSAERYEHIQRVTATCIELAPRFGVSPVHAEVVGLAHDLAREWEDQQFLDFVKKDGYQPDQAEQEKPLLLHGRCASILLRNTFSVRNPSILSAVIDHTLGREGMDMLGILLYVSDYLEPGRRYTTPEFRKRVHSLSPWEMVIAVNEHSTARGKYGSAKTEALQNYAREKAGLEMPAVRAARQGAKGA